MASRYNLRVAGNKRQLTSDVCTSRADLNLGAKNPCRRFAFSRDERLDEQPNESSKKAVKANDNKRKFADYSLRASDILDILPA